MLHNLTTTCLFQSLFLDEGGQAEFWICCDPGYYLDRLSRIIDEVPLMHFFCEMSSYCGFSSEARLIFFDNTLGQIPFFPLHFFPGP